MSLLEFYRINLTYACYGLIVEKNIIIEAPPIGRWMIGKHIKEIGNWTKRKNGEILKIKTLINKEQNDTPTPTG